MFKIACIGDVHGSPRWKEALDLDVDHLVFVGDYVDTPDFSNKEVEDNLIEILEFKKKHLQKVTLLLGNHDIQYLYYPTFQYIGFNFEMLAPLESIFKENLNHFQVARLFGDYLFTHAGLHRKWAERYLSTESGAEPIDIQINLMLSTEAGRTALAEAGRVRRGTFDQGGPFWCDYNRELLSDPYPGINQVVGHTRTKFLLHHNFGGTKLYNVNYLAYSNEPIFILKI